MVIGGCGGGALGIFLHQLAPQLAPHPASFIILGMAGFFAAAAKTPFSTLIIVSEMTGDYQLLLPALWVVTIAFLFSDEAPLYQSQVKSRSLSPAHQGSYVREVLAGLEVNRFLIPATNALLIQPGEGLNAVIDRLGNSGLPALPVVDDSRRLQGMVVLDEVHLATQTKQAGPFILAVDLMRPGVQALVPDDRLDKAMELFVAHDILALPVVDSLEAGQVVGMVRRADVAHAYLRQLHGQPEKQSPT
jgi:CIC family chloride channel protein